MERLICLILGYLFGLIQTGYFYSKLHHVDIRKEGSGNSGSTNILRVMGVKAGLTVFMGDFLKTVIPCAIARFYFAGRPEVMMLMVLYTGIGAILGHNYPVYLGFKGGKGIACTAGILCSMDLRVTAVCLILFIMIVAVSGYVSLGSLVVVTVFLIGMVYFGNLGDYGINRELLPEFYIASSVVTLLAFWKHRANIVRLVQGKENKFYKKKT